MCFIIEPDQIEITALGAAAPAAAPDAKAKDVTPAAEAPAVEAKPAASALKEPAKATTSKSAKAAPKKAAAESSSIRVSVDKVDQIINLVGELIITQSMLDQTVSDLGDQSVGNSSLQNGMSLLQRTPATFKKRSCRFV
ncbi:hypothetical protein DK37_10000 [Halomonas sp. SUBG004]|nr:hypothetical protein DK37_10000 [Halomonas sp. SUBG004]